VVATSFAVPVVTASELSEKSPMDVLVEHTNANKVFEHTTQRGDANTTDQAANTGGEMVNNREVPAIAASEDPRESAADVEVDDDRPSEALTEAEDATDIAIGAAREAGNELLTPANAALVDELDASDMVLM